MTLAQNLAVLVLIGFPLAILVNLWCDWFWAQILPGRDSDRHPEGDETGTGSVGEADRARAEGIARKEAP